MTAPRLDVPRGVGTLREKPLHAALKAWVAEPGDLIEHAVDGFVIDLVRGDTLIEVQTRGFTSMKRKLPRLLEAHDVRVVHPIPLEKWILRLGGGGELLSRRRSPRRGAAIDVFAELVSFPELVAHPRFSLEVLITREEELRRFEAGRAWRRKGWVVEERRLIEVVDRVPLDTPAALGRLLPPGLDGEFTTSELAEALRRPRRLAQQMAYCLRATGVIEPVNKRANAVVYARTEAAG